MPSISLGPVFANLPELKTLHIDNIDDFTKEQFLVVFNKLTTYQGLEKLGLELVPFDLEEQKEMILNVMKLHSATLRHVSFAKNKTTVAFMNYICEGMSCMSNIESIDLKHLKEAKTVDWTKMLASIAQLSNTTKRNVQVSLSGY